MCYTKIVPGTFKSEDADAGCSLSTDASETMSTTFRNNGLICEAFVLCLSCVVV